MVVWALPRYKQELSEVARFNDQAQFKSQSMALCLNPIIRGLEGNCSGSIKVGSMLTFDLTAFNPSQKKIIGTNVLNLYMIDSL